eukprot:g9001.t1
MEEGPLLQGHVAELRPPRPAQERQGRRGANIIRLIPPLPVLQPLRADEEALERARSAAAHDPAGASTADAGSRRRQTVKNVLTGVLAIVVLMLVATGVVLLAVLLMLSEEARRTVFDDIAPGKGKRAEKEKLNVVTEGVKMVIVEIMVISMILEEMPSAHHADCHCRIEIVVLVIDGNDLALLGHSFFFFLWWSEGEEDTNIIDGRKLDVDHNRRCS